jgi:DNA-binding IclR family transcriptional regulator
LDRQKNAVRVTDAARFLGIPLSVASLYLRALNARGLLRAQRRGREVAYQLGDDPALPETRVLLNALRSSLGHGRRSLEACFDAFTGFTHPRRITIVQAVAQGALRIEDIRAAAGISRRATTRHLRKLIRRGYLVRRGRNYLFARPASPLRRSLLRLALSSK